MSSHERHHRRSTQIPPSEINRVHHLLSRAFSGEIPASRNQSSAIDPEIEEADYSSSSSSDSSETNETENRNNPRSFIPSNVGTTKKSYSRAMHAYHTTSQPTPSSLTSSLFPGTSIEETQQAKQPSSPLQTFPNYTRTMHAFTLNQLNHLANTGSHNQPKTKPGPDSHARNPTATPLPTGKKPSEPQRTKAATTTTAASAGTILTTSPLALKLPPSQSRTQYLSRSLSILNQMSLDEEPCGPSNTPEPFGENAFGKPPPVSAGAVAAAAPLRSSVSGYRNGGVDRDGDSAMQMQRDVDMAMAMVAPPISCPMSMSSSEMLAQGRELEARFEALIRFGGGGGGGGISGHESSGGSGSGLEIGGSEARDFARFGMVL